MKFFYSLLILLAISCEKKTETFNKKTVEENCFQMVKVGRETPKKPYKEPTKEQILQNLPKHIQFEIIEDKNNFEENLKYYNKEIEKEKQSFISEDYQLKYKNFITYLPEFQYIAKQNQFALAKNKYGLWLIEKNEKQKAKPYFLGLTQNIFISYNYNAPNHTFMGDESLYFWGTIIKVTRLSKYPILPKYEVIKDDVEFKINISDIKKDSDNDGYNDLFENFIGLNPNKKDSDDDGISDFEDTNPRYKSANSKFTQMYLEIADEPATKTQYSFTEVLTDCDYFNQLNPKNQKFLFYNIEENIPLKEDILDNFFPVKYSRIQENRYFKNTYNLDYADAKGSGTISAEFINGKWKISKKMNLYFGV